MKLLLSSVSGVNLFTGYGDGYVMVNRLRHERSLLVLPDRLVGDWRPLGFDDLQAADFDQLATLDPEVVLLGTGARLRFPPAALTRKLIEARIGLEVMDVQAACRTYNILAAEERKVAAALLFS